MALLKKVRSATLIESLVATVLIVVVFIAASLILNNLLLNIFSNDTHSVEQRIAELEYKIRNNTITLPYNEEYGKWNIEVMQETLENNIWLTTTAVNNESKKEFSKSRLYESN